MPRKCSKDNTINHNSILPEYNPLVQSGRKNKFNDPSLPDHINDKTIFGIITQKCNITDIVYPNKQQVEGIVNDKINSDLYKISHHIYKTEERLNRKYTANFAPNIRFGKCSKLIPPGLWFKHNIQDKSLNANSNNNINVKYGRTIFENEKNNQCIDQNIDTDYQKLFKCKQSPNTPHVGVGDILTGNESDEKELQFAKYLTEIIKTKRVVKNQNYNLTELRETYKFLDKESTGWLPMDQVYMVCYQHNIRPDKKLFGQALNSIHAINNTNIRYDLFVDLLDPHVKFTEYYTKENKSEIDRFVPTYKNDYQNKFSQCAQLNEKNTRYNFIKPIILAYQECWGSETDVKALLNPTIFTNYGLSYRDFYEGRSKEEMEKIFQNVGLNLPTNTFNIIWDNAYRLDGFDNNVSLEVFKQALQEYAQTTVDHQK